MRAVVYSEPGDPGVLRYEHVPEIAPGPGEFMIRVEAVGVQGGDVIQRRTDRPASVPFVPGAQAAGTVVEIGDGVAGVAIGDRMVTVGAGGACAEFRIGSPAFSWHIPDGLSTDDAACVPIEFGTAHDCLFEFGRLRAGETVLVHAGASGVGVAAIQLAKQAGATVIATASSEARLDRLRAFGLDHGIDYTSENFVARARELTGGRGLDLVVDLVGGTTLQQSLDALAYRGRCIDVGNAGREQLPLLDVSGLHDNNRSLVGYFFGMELFMGGRAHAVVADLLLRAATGGLAIMIDRTFAFSEAAEAHAFIESRQAFGRVVLRP